MTPTSHIGSLLALLALGFGLGAVKALHPILQYLPGDTANTVDEVEIDQILSDVVANNGGTHIRVALGIASLSHTLENPQFFLKDGASKFTLPKQINANQTGLILFQKYSIGVKGVHGVVAYDVVGTQLILAILFTVPENSISYDSYFNLKLYYKETPVDRSLVDQMYEYAGAWKAGAVRGKRSEYGVTVEGTMTKKDKAKLAAFIDASGYNIRLGPTRHSECAFRASALGSRCWRECTPTGWCWTSEKCDHDRDCNGNMYCSGACESV